MNFEKQQQITISPKCEKLLKEFNIKEQEERIRSFKALNFQGVEGKTVYNTTTPFVMDETEYIVGRVESPELETDSQAVFFTEKNEIWTPDKNIQPFDLQDPFFKKINGELIFGGIKTFPKPTKDYPEALGYKTVFYRDHKKGLKELEQFVEGPDGMKGIRLTALRNGKIGMFTRSQDWEQGNKGKMGFAMLNSLEDLNTENISKAELINMQFNSEEWGGVNQIHVLSNNKLGIIGHIASSEAKTDENGYTTETKDYYAVAFCYDPETQETTPFEIIAQRKDLPDELPAKILKSEKKTTVLENIIYPSGLMRNKDGTADLYISVGDSSEGIIEMPDPFLKYE
ncbi:DUF1861 family protein [Patescibacteria group bacterium]|nr:DUF1861 family protein [Patescibacteria group bacterium]